MSTRASGTWFNDHYAQYQWPLKTSKLHNDATPLTVLDLF